MKFSIVVPIYNKAAHISETIDSVLAQTFDTFELIFVDDASTDASVDIIKQKTAGRSDVVIVKRTEPGPGGYAARNAGAQIAKYKYVVFLDADDAWHPEFLSSIAAALGSFPDAKVVSTGYSIKDHRGTREISFPLNVESGGHSKVSFGNFLRASLQSRWPIHTSAVAIDRDFLFSVGGFPEGRCLRGGDRDTWLRCVANGEFVWVNKRLAVYNRDSENMVTRQTAHPRFHCLQRTIQTLIDNPEFSYCRKDLVRMFNWVQLDYLRQQRSVGRLRPRDLSGLKLVQDPAFLVRVLAMLLLQKPRFGR